MKILCWNVNGIRAVERKKSLQALLSLYDPDILFIQEIKAKVDKLSKYLTQHPNYQQFYHSAEKAGYSGTGVWIKKTFADIQFFTGMLDFTDTEGRIARIDYLDYSMLGVYFPNGGKSPEAWQGKLKFYDKFLLHINKLREQNRKVIWCGDINCAHQEIDIARPKENMKSIGFLPEERDWIDQVIAAQWIDCFRHYYPETVIYSWWHYISKARQRNVGWRIDYFFVDQPLIQQVKEIKYLNEQMGSDHCPILLEFAV